LKLWICQLGSRGTWLSCDGPCPKMTGRFTRLGPSPCNEIANLSFTWTAHTSTLKNSQEEGTRSQTKQDPNLAQPG